MSDLALEAYRRDVDRQLARNDARKIRSKVQDARNSPVEAGGRWPFELLQNACDAGAREPSRGITVDLGWRETEQGREVFFAHDAAPFETSDLAALLSGGSSKDFDSDGTTGRFGTGFLVTHVLACRVRIEGLLRIRHQDEEHGEGSRTERFEIDLDREGDEGRILASRDAAHKDIGAATMVDRIDTQPSAHFRWLVEDTAAYDTGVELLESSLPYVFATCPELAQVRIADPEGGERKWVAEVRTDGQGGRLSWGERRLRRLAGDTSADYRVIWTGSGDASAMVLAREVDGGLRVELPDAGVPRLFRRFPLRGTTGLPIEAVLDGAFDVNQERRLPSVTASGALIRQAFDAAVEAVEVAFHLGFEHAHRLCRVGPPTALSDREWWLETLRKFARRLAARPLVDTGDAMHCPKLPQDHETNGEYVEFPDPVGDSPKHLERLWHLMVGIPSYDPPARQCVEDWVRIAREWATLDPEARLVQIDLHGVGEEVRGQGDGVRRTWSELEVRPDPQTWLFDYIDAVGFTGASDSSRALPPYLDGLLPDQTGRLRDCSRLARDGGIPDALKEIATALGIRIRTELLHLDIEAAVSDTARPHIEAAIATALGAARRSTAGLVERCITQLDRLAPLERKLDDDGSKAALQVPELIRFLWQDMGESGASLARRVPLLSGTGYCQKKIMMPPLSRWPETARPHAAAWPPSRILDEAFAADETIEALVGFELVHADFCTTPVFQRVEGARLSALMVDGGASDEPGDGEECLVVDRVQLESIPLLHDGILNRCAGNDPGPARSLLGFIVEHMAPVTEAWRTEVKVSGRRGQQAVEVALIGAAWVGELRRRAWVPVGDGDETARTRPSAATLKPILEGNDAWLRNNRPGVSLLNRFFGLDMLDLQLFGKGTEVRDVLARLVDYTGGDVQQLERVLAALDDGRLVDEQLGGLRAYGKAVEAAVRRALEAHGLSVELIDRGFDFRVTDDGEPSRGDAHHWLVEVKATTGREVKLTPLQARTAGRRAGRYVVCVVPFDAQPDPEATEVLDDAVRSARIITDIGPDALETTAHVDAARSARLSIRYDDHLRYAIPASRWEEGLTIDEWIGSIKDKLAAIELPDADASTGTVEA